jgi:hypothetical protein
MTSQTGNTTGSFRSPVVLQHCMQPETIPMHPDDLCALRTWVNAKRIHEAAHYTDTGDSVHYPVSG